MFDFPWFREYCPCIDCVYYKKVSSHCFNHDGTIYCFEHEGVSYAMIQGKDGRWSGPNVMHG